MQHTPEACFCLDLFHSQESLFFCHSMNGLSEPGGKEHVGSRIN